MSNFGLLMIIVWGLAYIAAPTIKVNIKWLAAAFAFEKLVYVYVWLVWQLNNELSSVYAEDLFVGVFFTVYGLNNFVFMPFFVWLIISESKRAHA